MRTAGHSVLLELASWCAALPTLFAACHVSCLTMDNNVMTGDAVACRRVSLLERTTCVPCRPLFGSSAAQSLMQ